MVGGKRNASLSATKKAARLSDPAKIVITAEIVHSIAQDGEIPREKWPRLEQRLRSMLSKYGKAKRRGLIRSVVGF
jgi:hypothetical protein